MPNQIIIYSHGFGVRQDDRGLFTDIAASLPEATHIMFDYNLIDDEANTLTAKPLTEQARALGLVIAQTQKNHPTVPIHLIAHSQGCLVAALANPKGIRKIIFTAPPFIADIEDTVRQWPVREGTQFTTSGPTYLARKDGSTTIVPPEYWASLKHLDAQELYNTLAKNTDLTIITATRDEVLGDVIFDSLAPNIKVVEMPTGHNFEGNSRQELTAIIAKELRK